MPTNTGGVREAVILAAGQGTRLWPLTHCRPKPLIPVLNRPFLQHQLELMESCGIRRTVLIIGYMKEAIEDWLSTFQTRMQIITRVQREARGTGDAINTARGSVNGDFVVMNGDILLDRNGLMAMLESGSTSVAAKEVDNPQDFGVFEVKRDSVVGVVEKAENPPSNLANVGCYVFENEIFDRIDTTPPNPKRGEVEITDTLQGMVDEKLHIRCFRVSTWNELGKPWDVINLTETYIRGEAGEGDFIRRGRGRAGVKLGNGTLIEGDSKVIGPSLVGRDCRIEGGAVVGPNCSVGNGTIIRGARILGSVIMDGCQLEPGARVEYSVLASGVVVERDVSLLSKNPDGSPVMLDIKGQPTNSGRTRLGSIIGDQSRIGSGTSLDPGTMLAPRTSVPAKGFLHK